MRTKAKEEKRREDKTRHGATRHKHREGDTPSMKQKLERKTPNPGRENIAQVGTEKTIVRREKH